MAHPGTPLLLGAVALSLATCCGAAAPGGSDAWLNVQEHGASGSTFETTAATTAGSRQITVKDAGDFRAGQGITVSKCHPRILDDRLWGPGRQYTDGSGKPLKGTIDLRGYDETAGRWTVFILDVERADEPSFRWSDDIARTWQPKVPITYDWQPLRGGLEVRFRKHDWKAGYTATFSARDQLQTTIEKVEGSVLTLRDAPARSARDAVVRHRDDEALQAVLNRAVKEKRNVYFPVGHYRLARGLSILNPSGITVEGASGETTLLDISEGAGACFTMRGGTEVTIRNFRLVGHTGFAERDQAGSFPVWGCTSIWGQDLKTCFGTGVIGTERVLIENVHASRMSLECFWSGGPSRRGTVEPEQYTKAITYLRCSATDCGRNGFNNNDMAENTSILHCRIVDVGGCAWEGASRFVKFIGNYVRNAGTVAMGNIRSRDARFEVLPSGQHIVADNVFESNVPYGGCAIRAAAGATPVVIRDNLFVNFGSSAIELSGFGGPGLPARNGTITGNVFDMTETGPTSRPRCAIDVSESDTIVSNNQIYVRGAADANVTAIRLREPALNLNAHDNLIRNCGTGLVTTRGRSRVAEVVDARTFTAAYGSVPLEARRSHRYRGWHLVWLTGGKPAGTAVIETFDPETMRFQLKEPREVKVGDNFEVFSPNGANWSIHGNTITGCPNPVVLDGYGSETSFFKGNTISRGETTGAAKAVVVGGRFNLVDNHVSGFDEPGAAALALQPDPLDRACRNLYRGNTIERCAAAVTETRKGLWRAARADGNRFLECGGAPATGARAAREARVTPLLLAPTPSTAAVWRAANPSRPVAVDGDVSEWPWQDTSRAIALAQTPNGGSVPPPHARACAAWDGQALYVALRVPAAHAAATAPGGAWGHGDGVEVSFRSADPKAPSPIFLLWGSADGEFRSGPYGGASAEQVKALEAHTTFAARRGAGEWTCEWRISLAGLWPGAAAVRNLRLNLGLHFAAGDLWVAWVGTGGALYEVDQAGELVLGK